MKVQTSWFSLPATAGCFDVGQNDFDTTWRPSTDLQTLFLNELYPNWQDLKSVIDPESLKTKVTCDEDTITLFSQITTVSKWVNRGESHRCWPNADTGFTEIETAFPWDDPNAFLPDNKQGDCIIGFDSWRQSSIEGIPNPVFSTYTQADNVREEVFVTAYFKYDNSSPFSLWQLLDKAKHSPSQRGTKKYDKMYFPMISVLKKNSVGWCVGFDLVKVGSVVEANQQLELKVNEEGFYERAEEEMLVLRCDSDDESDNCETHYLLNGPMIYWRKRNGKLCFCAVIGNDDYANPGAIAF